MIILSEGRFLQRLTDSADFPNPETMRDRIAQRAQTKIDTLQIDHVLKDMMHDHCEFSDMFARILNGHGFDFAVQCGVDSEFPASTMGADGS